MDINDRVKLLRTKLNLTQEEFGNRLGVGRGAIRNIEAKIIPVKDLTINLICNVYKVNKQWLEKGNGNMFLSNTEAILTELAESMGIKGSGLELIKFYLSLNIEERKKIDEMFVTLSNLLNKKPEDEAVDETITEYKTVKLVARNGGPPQELQIDKKTADELNAIPELNVDDF